MNLPSVQPGLVNAATDAPAAVDPHAVAVPEGDAAPPAEATPVEVDRLARAKAVAEKAKQAAERNRKMRAEAAGYQQRAEQSQAEAQRHRAELEQLRAEKAEFLKDPTGKFRDYTGGKASTADIARRAIEENTPEFQIRQELAQERASREELQRKLDEFQGKIEAGEHAQKQRAAETAFTTLAADGARFPHLAGQPSAVVLAAAKTIISAVAQRRPGVSPSDNEVLEYLEYQYATHQKPGSAPASGGGDSAASGTKAPSQSRTVTSRMASERSTLPANFDSLGDREQKRALADLIRPMMTRE